MQELHNIVVSEVLHKINTDESSLHVYLTRLGNDIQYPTTSKTLSAATHMLFLIYSQQHSFTIATSMLIIISRDSNTYSVVHAHKTGVLCQEFTH